jgi:hypothetical protein
MKLYIKADLINEIQRMQDQSKNDWQHGYQSALNDILHVIGSNFSELPNDEEIGIESENYALKTHPNPNMITFRKYCADDFKQGVKYVLNKIQKGTI